MDQNNPARYLDTAYGALKSNPGATNQILQAAAQGAPVGLKGLAAAAAQQSQQQAQQAMAALQQQGPQPNVIQKLATQGIMSQMDTGLPMAPQMGAPEEMPSQMMAGGGLVSFADGGNVLPPDVIDAIQSHFAEGGDVRGFAYGKDVFSELASQYGQFAPLPGAEEDTGLLPKLLREIRGARVGRGSIPAEDVVSDTEEMFKPDLVATRGRGASVAPSGISTLDVQDFAPSGMYKPEVKETKAPATPATWKPEPHDGHEVVPRQRVIPEGTKVDKPFDEAKKDVPSAAVTPDSEAKGLDALDGGNLEHMRDLLAELRGHKEMSPEISQKLADLEDKARTSTILQSVLGGLAGGLSNPYGGRFALGSSAAGALGGYQKGIGSEEEIGRKAFDILRGYADAPAEEKAKAVDLLMDISKEKMRAQSAADLAEARSAAGLEKAILQGEFAQRRAETMAPYRQAPIEETQTHNINKEISDEKEMWLKMNPIAKVVPPDVEQAILRKVYGSRGMAPPGSSLGGAPLGTQRRIYD